MIDPILQQQPTWRYCRVRAGEKRPYPANWQKTPLLLHEVDSENIGLILGPAGLGVCAIDFDGTSAWNWFAETGIKELPITPTWTSGKQDRCQMAFQVPEEYWDVLETKKIQTQAPSKPGAGDGEGFEFRWAGGQSVLPPSIHPSTKRPYEWLVDATHEVAVIPEELLIVWLEQITKKAAVVEDTLPEVKLDDLDQFDINEAESVLKLIKERYPALSYEDWFRVTSGLAHRIGRDAALVLIKQYYPEQKSGEYKTLFRSWNKAKSAKFGSLVVMAGLKI
jgi:hypothetical protein